MLKMRIIATRKRVNGKLTKDYTWSWELWEDSTMLALGSHRPLINTGYDTKKQAIEAANKILGFFEPLVKVEFDEGIIAEKVEE